MEERRLIDANALKDKLISKAGSIKGKRLFDKGESWGFELAAKIVSYFPEIAPESLRPVARLEPVDPESDIEFKCSKCKGVISANWDGSEYFEYCPYCGARVKDSI